MSAEEKLGYAANLPRVQAQDTLHAGRCDWRDYRQIYALHMAAYGDRQLAAKARAKALELFVDSEMRAKK